MSRPRKYPVPPHVAELLALQRAQEQREAQERESAASVVSGWAFIRATDEARS